MGSEWKEVALESLTELIVDCPHSTPKWTEDGFIVLRSQNIRNGNLNLDKASYTNEEGFNHRTKRAKPTAGDLVLTREAPMGEICKIPENIICCLGQRMVLIRPDRNKINSTFLLYAFQGKSLQHQIGWNKGTGTTVSNIRIPFIHALLVKHPPPGEQRAIAHLLSTLDDKIALLRRQNETLEAMARSLFNSWFVDFDPVIDRALAAGRALPDALAARVNKRHQALANTDYPPLPSEILKLFPDDFEFNEDLGKWVPAGWEVVALREIGNVICGKTPSTKDSSNFGSEVPFITIPDMHNKVFVSVTSRSLSNKGAESQHKKFIPNYAICVSCIATAGLVVRPTMRSQTNQQINSVVPFIPEHSNFWFSTLSTFGQLIKSAGAAGSVFNNLNKGSFEKILTLNPEVALKLAFSKTTDVYFSRILSNHTQLQTLTQLRDTLLPKLISGDLSVADFPEEWVA